MKHIQKIIKYDICVILLYTNSAFIEEIHSISCVTNTKKRVLETISERKNYENPFLKLSKGLLKRHGHQTDSTVVKSNCLI